MCAAAAALLLQDATVTATQIGSEPIYLQHHYHSHSSVNTHIGSNTTHLLWQNNAAAPCERISRNVFLPQIGIKHFFGGEGRISFGGGVVGKTGNCLVIPLAVFA